MPPPQRVDLMAKKRRTNALGKVVRPAIQRAGKHVYAGLINDMKGDFSLHVQNPKTDGLADLLAQARIDPRSLTERQKTLIGEALTQLADIAEAKGHPIHENRVAQISSRIVGSLSIIGSLKKKLEQAEEELKKIEAEAAALASSLKRLPNQERIRILSSLALASGLASTFSEFASHPSSAPKVANSRWLPEFPTKPLEAWDKPPGPSRKGEERETVTQFITRVYGHLIPIGFTRGHLKRIDPKLTAALRGWERSHPDEVIHDFPAGWTEVDELLEQLLQHYSMDQLKRLGLAIVSRERRESQAVSGSKPGKKDRRDARPSLRQ